MKTKMRMFNIQVFIRAAIVLVGAAAAALLFAIPLRDELDRLYRTTGSEVWYDLFYWISVNRSLVAMVGCLLALLLFSGWILRPAFNQFSRFISQNIYMGEGEVRPVKLPKELRLLQNEMNNVNKELRLWRYAAKEAEQRKDELVVYLAHDIRTPLTSVLGYLELLNENPELSDAQRQKFVQVALRKAHRMEHLVEELFEVTRYNVSQIELEKQEVNAGVLVNQLAEELEGDLREKQLAMRVENNLTGTLLIDPEKMARALDNVLHNAVYYTPRGGEVAVEVGNTAKGARICISNTGSEISQDKLDRFFEKFYRGDAARQSGTGGSGLGLAIAKNIIEAHGGSITAHNQNRVTTFAIELPRGTAAGA